MKVKYIICALAAALLSTSCNDFLQEDPKGQLTPGTFFSTQDELDMATYALYRKVCETQTNTNPTIPAWQGDDITANPGSNKQAYAEVDGFRPANNNKGVEAVWQVAYAAIKASNYIVLNANRTPTTEEEINIAVGQAKYWRAFNYFRLVRCFGPVPLVLDNEVDYERTPATVEEVYAQIVQDLQDCVNTLPTSYSTEPRFLNGVNVYITKQAAQATLGAVYMAMAGWPLNQTQLYADAATQLKAVIDGVNNGQYEYMLEPEYKHVYAPSHNYSNETVVGINYSGSFAWVEDSQMTLSHLYESLGGWGDGWGSGGVLAASSAAGTASPAGLRLPMSIMHTVAIKKSAPAASAAMPAKLLMGMSTKPATMSASDSTKDITAETANLPPFAGFV